MFFELLSNKPFSHTEKIETLIYLFVLQLALAASLLCSLGTPSHTLELKINSFYLGRGSNGFLIWRKYRNNGWARCQKAGGKSDPRPVPGRATEGATRLLPGYRPAPRAGDRPRAAEGLRDEPPTGQAPFLDLCLHQGSGTGRLSASSCWFGPEWKESCFWSSNNSGLMPSSVLGAWSSSVKLCLSFLICHQRTGILPLSFSHGCWGLSKAAEPMTGIWHVQHVSPGAGFLSVVHSGSHELSGDAFPWRAEGCICCFWNSQQWEELALSPKVGVCLRVKQRPLLGTSHSHKG